MCRGININKIIETHLVLEFSMHSNTFEGIRMIMENKPMLIEKYGLVPNIKQYVIKALNYFKPQIKNVKKETTITLSENIFKDIETCFFNTLDIIVTYTYSKTKCGSSGATNFRKNGQAPFITLNITSDHKTFDREFSSIFAHELTHLYENYKRIRNIKGGKNLISALSDDGYFLNKEWGESTGNIGADRVKFLRYWFTKPELNAYLNNINQELEYSYDDEVIHTAKDMINLLQNTPTFKNIRSAYNVLVSLYNETDEDIQEKSIEMWNELLPSKKVKSYNHLRKILFKAYYKRYRRFVTKVCKIAYNIYDEHQNNRTMPSTTNVVRPPL